MSTSLTLQQTEGELMRMRANGGMEQEILTHWRAHQPKLVEQLLDKQSLMATLRQKAEDLLDMQMSLERTERLNPVVAKLEAWRLLMMPQDDTAGEAEAFGMTVEEYRSRA